MLLDYMKPIVKMIYKQEGVRSYKIGDLRKRWGELAIGLINGTYRFRDGDHSLYIGESEHIYRRLHTHIFIGGTGEGNTKCSMYRHINNNSPRSNNWIIDIVPLELHDRFLEVYYPDIVQKHTREDVEKAVIPLLRPSLNEKYNTHALPLPESFIRTPKQPDFPKKDGNVLAFTAKKEERATEEPLEQPKKRKKRAQQK